MAEMGYDFATQRNATQRHNCALFSDKNTYIRDG